jgi:hypothetical protein
VFNIYLLTRALLEPIQGFLLTLVFYFNKNTDKMFIYCCGLLKKKNKVMENVVVNTEENLFENKIIENSDDVLLIVEKNIDDDF